MGCGVSVPAPPPQERAADAEPSEMNDPAGATSAYTPTSAPAAAAKGESSGTSALAAGKAAAAAAAASAEDHGWDDWDDEEDGATLGMQSSPTIVQPSKYAAVLSEDGTLTLGGSAYESTLNAALRCTCCGTGTVWRFPKSRWDASKVDYYHFRNYAPDSRMPERTQEDLAKLCKFLNDDEVAAAYACGCSWQTISDAKVLLNGVSKAPPNGGARFDDDQALLWVADASH